MANYIDESERRIDYCFEQFMSIYQKCCSIEGLTTAEMGKAISKLLIEHSNTELASEYNNT